jgi:hypothetical protein
MNDDELAAWRRKNERVFRENYPRHAWALDNLIDRISEPLLEKIRASGGLIEDQMLFLWEKATEIEKELALQKLEKEMWF